jgi:hypothetical protein
MPPSRRRSPPTLTADRAQLQTLRLSLATINRRLVSLKRFCAWSHEQQLVAARQG